MPYKDPQRKRDNEKRKRKLYPEVYKARRYKWIINNQEKWKAGQRKYRFKSRYGITVEEYDQKCIEQDFRCIICQSNEKELVVDHSHKTGNFRGVICNPCNSALGLFKDNILVLYSAIDYLKKRQ